MSKKQERKFTAKDLERVKREYWEEGYNSGYCDAVREAMNRIDDLHTLPEQRRYRES